jgi:deferrochelatase/peroxidase EfeB
MGDETPPGTPKDEHRLTRRGVLGAGVLLGAGAGIDRLIGGQDGGSSPIPAGERGSLAEQVPFYAAHQAGIDTPAQECLQFAAFDLTSESIEALRDLMRLWTAAAVELTAGRPSTPHGTASQPSTAASDPGEALGLGPAALTITVGFGPGLFEKRGLGLQAHLPPELQELPAFEGDALDPARSGGEIAVQACSEDPQVAFHAIHVLRRLAAGTARLRWTQAGFGRTSVTTRGQHTLRNLMGFKDGTDNIRAEEGAEMERYVWVQDGDGPDWMSGGSYLIARRIRILFDGWDSLSVAEQERTVGRTKLSGAPLGEKAEHDAVNLTARNARGESVIPDTAHIRVASPLSNSGQRILRRGYSFSEPTVADEAGEIEAGLFFIAFQRSPLSQFVPLQTRLANFDALSRHTLHTSSAIFACPAGTAEGSYIGHALLS